MALTKDCHTTEYGVPEGNSLTAAPVGANQQLYSGAVALISGGTGATAGYVKNGNTSVGTTDICAGIVGDAAGGTFVETGPGILGGTTDGAVWINVRQGAFFIQSGTGSDLLSAATNWKTVYYGGENNNGPIACATSGSGTRPVLGTQLPQDPGIAGTVTPGANYWPVKFTAGGA